MNKTSMDVNGEFVSEIETGENEILIQWNKRYFSYDIQIVSEAWGNLELDLSIKEMLMLLDDIYKHIKKLESK